MFLTFDATWQPLQSLSIAFLPILLPHSPLLVAVVCICVRLWNPSQGMPRVNSFEHSLCTQERSHRQRIKSTQMLSLILPSHQYLLKKRISPD